MAPNAAVMILFESKRDSLVINVVMDGSREFFCVVAPFGLDRKIVFMSLLGLRFHPWEEQDLVAERSACVT